MKKASSWICFCLIAFCGIVRAETRPPRLVVIIVGDQVRADYLERFHDALLPDGLRRFRDSGTYFMHARRDDAVTKTSPGHVLIGSGLYASQSGVIDNDWYDRSQHRVVSPTELVTGGARTQLRWFKGTSLATRLHRTYPSLRFVSLSLKDRAALLLGGPDQDEAYWWDRTRKQWISYHPAAAWLTQFNQRAASKMSSDPTPAIDDATEALAEDVLAQWRLGHNPQGESDVLTINFSAVDLVGHKFGPDGEEMKTVFLNLDRDVAKLMAAVKKEAGDSVLWVFSSDHGVTPLPEVSRAHGLEAYRVSVDAKALPDAETVEAVHLPWIYLKSSDGEKGIQDAVLKIPGVAAVYRREDLLSKQAPLALLHSFDPERCGDLWVVLKPKSIFSAAGASGTTHGQPTDDDQEIPLGFYGEGIPIVVRSDVVSPVTVAPTLLQRLQAPPGSDLSPPLDLNLEPSPAH